jgi:hypothetical protein
MRSVPLIVSTVEGGVTCGGAGVELLQAIDSTNVRAHADAEAR